VTLKEISLAFLVSLSLSVLATPLARIAALKFGLMDRPRGRKKHLMSTPLLGGMAIYLSFALTILLGLIMINSELDRVRGMLPIQWGTLCVMVMVAGGLMALVGLLDDILGMKPSVKLLFHTLAAVLAGVFFITKGALLSIFLTESSLAWLTVPITVFWLVGITNSVNLLDHADGLSAGTCAIAAIFFALVNILSGNYPVSFISAALAGASVGFFFFNSNPASIFMGDCGSNMLGFMLGIIAVLGVYTPAGSTREIAIFTPVLILALPLIDTTFVITFRWKNGRPLFSADNNHLAHRLMRIGLTHQQAVRVLLVVAVLMSIPALLLPTLSQYQAILVFVDALGLVALFAFFMHHAEKRDRDNE
jgi:UDP-GlcNAc:undecaprenyl-phosphate/decaprenyl-phosphate GlcNAc-1-phosphate transferase